MNETLIAEAEIGEEARVFLESDLGKCVLGMAEQEVLLAREMLEQVNPEDTKSIRELQNTIWKAKSFKNWLFELMDRGDAALKIYIQEKHEQEN